MRQRDSTMCRSAWTTSEVPAPRVVVPNVVIVDGRCDRYGPFFDAAASGRMSVHVCVDGRSAMRLARRFHADCWLVAVDLADMCGFDLLDMLSPQMLQPQATPQRWGDAVSGNASLAHPGVFLLADSYRLADEQRALASGAAGYLVGPVGLDVVHSMRLVTLG
jgi:CheY-like chemotaxis protein